MGECSLWGDFGWKVLVLTVIGGDVPWGKLHATWSVLHFEVPWLSCQIKMCVRQWRI